jgi:signal transduction histidine kinase
MSASPLQARLRELREINERLLLGSLRERELAQRASSAVSETWGLLERESLIAAASTLLAAPLEEPATLQTLAGLLARRLGEWCVIDLVVEGSIKRVAAAHVDPENQRRLRQSTRFPGVPNSAVADLAAVRLSVPLEAQGEVLGTLTVGLAGPRILEAGERSLLEEIGRRTALAVHNTERFRSTQAALRIRDQVLAEISHDLTSPLAAIRMQAEAMLMQASSGQRRRRGDGRKSDQETERLRDAMAIIRDCAAQALRLSSELVDFSRLQEGRLVLDKTREDLVELAQMAVRSSRPLAARKGVKLDFRAVARSCQVLCDRQGILRALLNVIDNAIKFTPARGAVVVSVHGAPAEGRLHVTDSGPGVAPADRRNIFKRYWTSRSGQSGSGLGLHVARGFVEAHGGRIWLERGRKKGAGFWMRIPCAQDQGHDSTVRGRVRGSHNAPQGAPRRASSRRRRTPVRE